MVGSVVFPVYFTNIASSVVSRCRRDGIVDRRRPVEIVIQGDITKPLQQGQQTTRV